MTTDGLIGGGLTEVSSSLSWTRLSWKSCSSVSVRPPTTGGVARTARGVGQEVEKQGEGLEGEEQV